MTNQIGWIDECAWSKRDKRVIAYRREKLGALVLDERLWKDASEETIAQAMLEGVRALGINLSPAEERFRTRVALLRSAGEDLPDLSDDSLLSTAQRVALALSRWDQNRAQLKALNCLSL